MNNKNLIKKSSSIFPIAKYNQSNFAEDKCVSFTGSPLQHPYEKDKFILISDPLSEHTQFLEFLKSDIAYVEDLTSILSKKGESIHITKVWITIGVVALRYEPFIVGRTSDILKKIKKLK